jgi:DNA adenine methylase
MSKTKFTEYRQTIKSEPSMLQRAALYFIINRCSFSGATFSGGYSQESMEKRFTKSSIERIKNLDLSKFTFTCLDFAQFFDLHDEALRTIGHFIYADPPYMLGKKSSKLYGNNGDLHENFPHETFKEYICKYPNWIISYNDCKEIRHLYQDFVIIDCSWTYGMRKPKKDNLETKNDSTSQEKNSVTCNEILIFSKNYIES